MKWFRVAVILIMCYITVCLGLFPQKCMSAVTESLNLCASSVIPALFPFFVCSSLLVSLGAAELGSRSLSGIMRPVFGVDGAAAIAVVLGLISGYPVGADCAATLYNSGKITKNEAERLIGFCNNSGPLFIIGTVGFSLNGSPLLGGVLYIIHIISAISAGIILSHIIHEGSTVINPELVCESQKASARLASAFGGAISKSVITILNVCGFVVFFAVLESTIPEFPGHEFLNSLLEITGGISGISKLNIDPAVKFSFISMFLAFSGLSVFLQVASILSGTRLSLKPYLLGKLIQGIIAFVLTFAFMRLFGLSGSEYAGVFSDYDSALSMYACGMYACGVPPLNISGYLILLGGEAVWLLLSFGALMLAAKLLPNED